MNISFLIKIEFMILGHNWFYRPRIDAELKKYETLAFIQYLENCLKHKIIAQPFEELQVQKNSIEQYLIQSSNTEFSIDKKIRTLDWNEGKIVYDFKRDPVLSELDEIASFMLKMITPYLNHFDAVKKEILNEIQVSSVGIIPSYVNEGWFLLKADHSTAVFKFNSAFVVNDSGISPISTEYFISLDDSIKNTPENIKLDLIEQHPEMPQPMTYYFTSQQPLPLNETFLPLAIEKIQLNKFV